MNPFWEVFLSKGLTPPPSQFCMVIEPNGIWTVGTMVEPCWFYISPLKIQVEGRRWLIWDVSLRPSFNDQLVEKRVKLRLSKLFSILEFLSRASSPAVLWYEPTYIYPCVYSYHGRKHLQHILTNHLDRPLKNGGNGRRLGSFPFGAISAYFAKVNLLLVLGAGNPYGWWFRNPASQLSSLSHIYRVFIRILYIPTKGRSRSCSPKNPTPLGPQNTQSSNEAEAETL